jgi:3-oxoacyl-[acyl-carrier-protein] synthase-1
MAFFIADNIISPLGFTTEENFQAAKNGHIGIDTVNDPTIYSEPFPAAMINDDLVMRNFSKIPADKNYTRLEKMLILSITESLINTKIDISSDRTGMVLSTTKGNIGI